MLILLAAFALAADRADDFIATVDIDSTTGQIKRTLTIAQHVPLTTSQWAAERAAAATSVAAWLTWLQTNAPANYTYINGLTAARQEGLRQALLSLQ